MFTYFKIKHGKRQKYLGDSYRDEMTGKSRRVDICVHLWGDDDIERVKRMYLIYKKHSARARMSGHTKVYKKRAVEHAEKIEHSITQFKHQMAAKYAGERRKVDGRIGKLRKQSANRKPDVFKKLLRIAQSVSKELDVTMEGLKQNPHFGPISNWNYEQRMIVLIKIDPLRKILEQILSDLKG